MKALLTVLLSMSLGIALAETAPAAPHKADTKKEAPAKKEVKKHKKFEGEKVEGTKPDTPTKK